jgi:hypothetical protein
MKPTHDTSSNQRKRIFPLTDYDFQPTATAESISAAAKSRPELPGLYQMSSEFLGMEMSRDYVTEVAAFAIITSISAWSVITMAIAITRLVRNY